MDSQTGLRPEWRKATVKTSKQKCRWVIITRSKAMGGVAWEVPVSINFGRTIIWYLPISPTTLLEGGGGADIPCVS